MGQNKIVFANSIYKKKENLEESEICDGGKGKVTENF